MKTSEDKLNEALRAALKRKFDNFEDAPNTSAFEKIRANLKPGKQWKYLFFTVLFVSIAVVGVMTDQHYRKNSMAVVTIAKTAVAKTAVAKTAVAKTAVAKTEVAQTAVAQEAVIKKAVASKNYTLTDKQTRQVEPLLTGQKLQKESLSSVSEHHNRIIASVAPENLFANASVSNVPSSASEYSSNIEQNVIDITTQHETELSGENAVKFAPNMLDIQPVKFTSAHASLPGINVVKSNSKKVINSGSSKVNLLLNAAILQSYQILTVPSGSQSFQNFDFPSTFSLRSLGYKVSVGAEKKGFQFMLHYSWFHQAYSYEIAGNDYIVQTVDKDNFKVIRQGTRVSQDNKFRLLGVGVNKEVTWGNANVGKYYASAGLQYSYGLIRRQSIGWVNAGIGKQFPISKSTSLYIGPYAEFSAVKLSGSVDPFFYQPYRVGISAGLRLNR